jgi:hypothetical protein
VGLFKRTSTTDATSFWRQLPIKTADPAALYQYGISCVTQGDPIGMMQCGWAIWQLVGIHEHQAREFIYDGFNMWEQGEQRVRLNPAYDYSPERGIAFLRDYFDTLCASPPPNCPADIWSAPPALVQPAMEYYGARCFAGSRLLSMAVDRSGTETIAVYRPLVYRAIIEVPDVGFVPPRALDLARTIAAEQGLADPFP